MNAIPKHSFRLHRFLAASFAMVVMSIIYLGSIYVPNGWITYLLCTPALVIIIITAIARINDLQVNLLSAASKVRRMGLILSAVYAIGILVAPVFFGAVEDWPTWRTIIGAWGFALVWLTTPHLPPWWDYIRANYGDPNHEHNRRSTDDFDSNP